MRRNGVKSGLSAGGHAITSHRSDVIFGKRCALPVCRHFAHAVQDDSIQAERFLFTQWR